MYLTEAKFLSDDEFANLNSLLSKLRDGDVLTKTEHRDQLLIRLHIYLSTRSIETLGITPSAIGNNTLTVKGAKGSNDRTIPIPAALCRELKEYCHKNSLGPSERIFPITTRHFRRIWDQYRPNPMKGSKSTRHTGALKLLLHCGDIHAVQQYLGHKSLKSTYCYLQWAMNQKTLREKMAGMWGQKLIA